MNSAVRVPGINLSRSYDWLRSPSERSIEQALCLRHFPRANAVVVMMPDRHNVTSFRSRHAICWFDSQRWLVVSVLTLRT